MAPGQDQQLEKLVDEALKSSNFQTLDVFLQEDIHEGTTLKCSKQFLTKLDKLVSRNLDQKDAKSASLGLSILYKCGKNMSLSGGQGLSGVIAQGLVKKMVHWFEKCRHLWIQGGPQRDETLLNLSEDFFDSLMVVHEACKEGTYEITESLLYPIGQLAADPRIYILIQKEAIRKFNIILDKIPAELKKEKKILSSQEASDVMLKLASQILDGGDYDLQTALMEALCRMASPDQRKELADRWFNMEYVASAFVKIRDSEFETDCRKFLNLVNGMQGDRRRVYSYPCLEVFLDRHELLMPSDEKLEEYWIDFNLGSQSISFYFSLADEEAQEVQWDTICINENEVHSYTVTEEGRRHVLRLKLSELVGVGVVEGSNLTIHFSSSLDILQAARRVYGHSKNKSFVGKSSTSVVKTTVKIIMDESSSQAVVPESQVSLNESEGNDAPYCLPRPTAPLQMVTPAKRRISESTTFITSSAGGSVRGASPFSVVMPSNTPSRGKGKPALQMVHSCDRQGEFYLGELGTTAKTSGHGTTPSSTMTGGMIEQSDSSLQSRASKQATKKMAEKYRKNIPVEKAVEMVLAGQGKEQEPLEHSFVPDSQPTMKTERSIYSHWNKLSVSEMLMMPTQRINTLPRPGPRPSLEQQQERAFSSAQRVSVPGSGPISRKQLHTELTQRLQEVLNEMNQSPGPQEPTESQGKRSEVREEGRGSSWCAPKEPQQQQVGRKGLAKGKSKDQKSLEADPAPVKAPVKVAPTQVLQEGITANLKIKATGALSSKEKRDAEVAGSMVQLISSHYESNTYSTAKATADSIPSFWIPPPVNKSMFDKSWLPTAKKEVSGAASLMKSHNKPRKMSLEQREDIFAFNVDTPLSIGGKGKKTESSVISSSGIHDSWTHPSTTKKGQPVAKQGKRYVKKHLFSDTETDYAMTEVSWLRESSRKPKPKVTKYSRQAPAKPEPLAPDTTYESPDLPTLPPKPVKEKTKPNKVRQCSCSEAVEQPEKTVKPAAAPNRPAAAGRRPQRAAAITTKSYREPDTDDSQSESEQPPASKKYSCIDQLQKTEKTCHEAAHMKKKKTAPNKQPTKSFRKLESDHHSSQSETEQQPAPKKYFVGQQRKNENTCQEAAEMKKKKNGSSKQFTETYRELDSDNQSELEQPPAPKHNTEKTRQETTKSNKKKFTPAKEQMSVPKDPWAACLTSFSPSPPSIERMRSAERSAPTLALTRSPLLTPRGSPLPVSPIPPCQDTPSPILQLPKPPRSAVSGKGNFKPSSFYSAEMKGSASKNLSLHSLPSLPSLTPIGQTPAPCAAKRPSAPEMSPIQQPLSSAPQSPLSLSSQHLLTSTALELDKSSMPSPTQLQTPGDTLNHGLCYDSIKVSPVSRVSLSQSSTKSSVPIARVKGSATAALVLVHKMENTPSSDRELKPLQHHISGPSRKRHISHPVSSNSEEDEKEETKKDKSRGQHSARMRPRKLFKSSIKGHGQAQTWGEQSSLEEEDEEKKETRPKDSAFKTTKKGYQSIKKTTRGTVIEVSPEGEVSRVVSSSHMVSSSHWEAEVEDGDVDLDEDTELPDITVNPSDMGSMCRQFSSELQRKFQNRYRLMEVYNKQALKAAQQHVSSLSMQVNKYRTQRMEQVRGALVEEIHNLEQDNNTLKNMEKDLTIYWKKQSMAFRSYQEKETRRFETLKSAFQNNVCHSLEYEERIFTSQMCLMRKDMKSVQDRLLNEMQEEEMQSVRRGLQALFLPEGARF
ncbi:synaptonemal complex protein 2 [Centroberyx affinis]|uniref:synaptonemal complex protein 2 n=1 Tax=Centroberyx affinis TaxID=166261 RepID=UPI003A5BD2BD